MLIFCTLKKVMFFIDENINNWSRTILGWMYWSYVHKYTSLETKLEPTERWEKMKLWKENVDFWTQW